MIPNFALNLSEDGITLLQRAPSGNGWLERHSVSLGSDTLEDDLHALRAKAVELEDENFATKLVLPASQLRYTTVEVGDDPRADILEALVELTPYEEDQIIFDRSGDGPKVQVVAVAKETLEEAENFLAPFRLNPIGFTAIPEADQFTGEPNLGTPAGAGKDFQTDTTTIKIIEEDTLALTETPPEPVKTETQSAPTNASPNEVEDEPELNLAPEVDTKQEADAKPEADAKQEVAPEQKLATEDAADQDQAADIDDTSDAPKPAAIPAPTVSAFPLPKKKPEAPIDISARAPKPFAAPAPPQPKTPEKMAKTGSLAIKKKPAEIPPKLGGAMRATSKTQDGKTQTGKMPASRTEPQLTTPKTSIPKPIVGAAQKRPGADAPKFEKSKRTKSDPLAEMAAKQVGGKPRFLGLILTAMLLLALGLLALLSSYFPASSPVANIFDEPILQTPDVQTAEALTDPEAEFDEIAVMDELELAALPTDITTPDFTTPDFAPDVAAPAVQQEEQLAPLTTPTLTTAPALPAPLSENEARTSYAATGIWQLAPKLEGQLDGDTLDDLYVASLDPKVAFEDAPALPRYEPYSTDAVMQALVAPVPPGTVFDLDESGLVRATPEGALNPDGILIFAGQPPIAAIPRPENPNAQALPTDDPNRLAQIRPLERPSDLIEAQERATLGGLARSELAQIRPKQRPISEQQRQAAIQRALAEASTSGVLTPPDADPSADPDAQLAVVAIRRPLARPKGFEKLVAAASRRAPAAGSPSTAKPAGPPVVASSRAKPSAPTTQTVARAATQNDIVPLGKLSLIGITGSSSNRRALVRMPNGKFKRVTVGDRLNGGRVRAIGEDVLKYTKGSRTLTLAMPQG